MMRAFASILAIALYLASLNPALAEAADAERRNLVLEVWLNGASRGLVVNVAEHAGNLYVERSDLGAIGLKDVEDSECQGELVPLNRINGVRASVEEGKQLLLVTAAPTRLAVTTLSLRGSDRQVVADTPVTAFAAEYDVVLTETDVTSSLRRTSIDGVLALSAFTPIGTFATNGFAVADADGRKALRLDSSWTLDDPPELRRLTIGDAVSGGVGWSRSVRFGGVQIARDFSLQPDLVTIPMPDFFGEAAVPGSIDVFVGASKVLSDDVPAGPFDIRDLPIVTGAGQATVVVRDLLGREARRTINYFTDSDMLAEGLTSYSAEAGFLRKSYGLKSFDYGDALVSATLRHGVSDDFTIEGHAEATPAVVVAGVGGVVSLFDFGSLRFAGVGSSSDFGDGGFGSIALSMQFGPANLFAGFEAATPAYRDVAAIDDATSLPRETLQLGGGLDLQDYGSLSLTYLRRERRNDERTTLATATYSVSVGAATIGVTSVYDVERDALLAETFFTVPLGGGGPYATATLTAQEGDMEVRATLEQPASHDGTLGYRLQARHGDLTQFNADGRWEGQNAAFDGRLALAEGNLSAQLEAAGAIVSTGDSAFFTRKLDGAFALVDAGEPGVRLYRENRLVAESDESGVALLTGLVPFTRNHIAVDPGGYDMSRVLARTDLDVVPGRGGASVSLAPAEQNPLALTVTLPDGTYPDVGTTAHLSGDPNPWIVGYRGALFVADLKLPLEAVLETKFGLCRLSLTAPPPPSPGEIPRLGPIACAFGE